MWQPDYEAMERDDLERLQFARLRDNLALVAAKNPAYYDKLGKPKIDKLESLEALQQLPVLTKKDLRDAYPFGFACAPQKISVGCR